MRSVEKTIEEKVSMLQPGGDDIPEETAASSDPTLGQMKCEIEKEQYREATLY